MVTEKSKFVKAILTVVLISTIASSNAQSIKVDCKEQQKTKKGEKYPTIINTYFYKSFKLVETSYPDDVGRYFYHEHKIFNLVKNRYVPTKNSEIFNRNIGKLETVINGRIQKDFKKFSVNSTTRDCFTNIIFIPTYKINDMDISFHEDEIWFSVDWEVPMACRGVGGSIVAFQFKEIRQYLK